MGAIAENYDVRCPKCKRDDEILVEVKVWARVTEDGTDGIVGDHEWDDDSQAQCMACEHSGTVFGFRPDHQKKEEGEDDAA